MADKGRPTVMTEDKVKEIEAYFSNGATDLEACFLADISKQTLYNYQDNTPDYVDRKQALKDMVGYKAKLNIKEAIEKNDKDMSKWYAERKIKEFKQKTDITTNDESLQPLLVKFLNNDNANTVNSGDSNGI